VHAVCADTGADSRATIIFHEDDWSGVRVRAHVVFRGRVQGVFFRANTKACADSLGLAGWVRNRMDGTVEAVFEGEKDVVERAIEWCSTKQPHARVESRTVEYSAPECEPERFSVL